MIVLTGPSREPIIAGALVRRHVRRALLQTGVTFTEEKGRLDSAFYVDVPAGQVLILRLSEEEDPCTS